MKRVKVHGTTLKGVVVRSKILDLREISQNDNVRTRHCRLIYIYSSFELSKFIDYRIPRFPNEIVA